MGKISQQEFRQLARAAGRAAEPAALHRRHARPDHRRAAHARPAAQAPEGHRAGRRRLSPAAPGHRQEQQRQSRPGNFRDQPRPEAARQGTRRAGDRPVAAQPRGRAARGQAPAAVGPSGIGLDRAGRRHRAVHLPRGLLRRLARAQAPESTTTTSKIVEAYEEWQQDMSRVYGLAEADRRQAAPRLHRQGPAQVRQPDHQVQRRRRTTIICPRCAN